MQVFYELNENKGLSLALGFFDGVHVGHQEVIKRAVDFAHENGKKSAVITFQDHPLCFFYDLKPQYIMRKSDKIKLVENLGIDYLYFVKFDEKLAKMTAQEYLQEIITHFEPSAISTGFNHHFGAKQSGDVKYLSRMQEPLHYKYFEIQPKLYHGEVVSSTRIREDLALGKVQLVNAMLGYNYFLEETVVKGEQIGRTIGFKTANLIYPDDLVEVGLGVYKVSVEYRGEKYLGIANYGLRPTITKEDNVSLNSFQNLIGEGHCDPETIPERLGGKPVLEIHLFDFDKEIYGEKIKVSFIKKIRDEKRFSSLDELKCQIEKDVLEVKDL